MKRRNFKIVLVVLTILILNAGQLPASEINLKPSVNQLLKFETLYIDIQLIQPFSNPFDPDNIRVDAIIETPEHEVLTLPCFYESGTSPESQWKARFTPIQTGNHSYYIQSMTKRDTVISKQFYLKVNRSEHKGFLRINPDSKYSFVFDSGKQFRGVGLNLGWEVEPKWGDEKKYTYELFFDELEKNHGNFFRMWMCPWNLPLEWTRVLNYETFIDKFQNWDKTFAHSPGLILSSGKRDFTEDDLDRITIQSNTRESLVYNIPEIKKFKLELYYEKQFSLDDIQCFASADNQTYEPVKIEFSQTWNTFGDWQRLFVASLGEISAGMNYLKIEFKENLAGTPHLSGISIGHGAPGDILDAPGLGKYYQKTAERMDQILSLANTKGLYIMLAHDYHGVFKPSLDRWGSNDEWRRNPYNVANGGPCKTPQDFFTNKKAQKFYQNRLRYMVARWGYATNLACWEFWNEIDNVMAWQEVSAEAISGWHKVMADYLKEIDPYKHIVTTSVTNREVQGLWDIPNIELTQHHNYGPTTEMKKSILSYIDRFHKPDAVGEFSIGWKGPGKDYPIEMYQIELHNGLWRGMFAPTPILPMTWWWEWHFDQNHYFHFKPVADFVDLMIKEKKPFLQEVTVSVPDSNIEAHGLKGGSNIFIWLLNQGEETSVPISISMTVTANSKFLVKTFDTWSGTFSEGQKITAVKNQINLAEIALKGNSDLAIWLTPVAN